MTADPNRGVGQELRRMVLNEHARRRDQLSNYLLDNPDDQAARERAREMERNRIALIEESTQC